MAVRPVAPGGQHVVVLPEDPPVHVRITPLQRTVSQGSGETILDLALHDHEGVEEGFHLNVLQNQERAAPDATAPRPSETS